MMTLGAGEFIRRFLMHTLPDGFHRIRYYGLFTNGHRAEKLTHCRELLNAPSAPPMKNADAEDSGTSATPSRSARAHAAVDACCSSRRSTLLGRSRALALPRQDRQLMTEYDGQHLRRHWDRHGDDGPVVPIGNSFASAHVSGRRFRLLTAAPGHDQADLLPSPPASSISRPARPCNRSSTGSPTITPSR